MSYNQPFYVPISKRHLFHGVNAWGYLPPLEYDEPPSPLNGAELSEPWQKEQWNIVRQLQGQVAHLQKKIAELSVTRRYKNVTKSDKE